MNRGSQLERILGGLWGSLVGDALGVPVEFCGRTLLQQTPVEGMRGFGTHHQPPGTWSDDSSLLLCTTESLVERGFSVDDMAQRFLRWHADCHWTPHGEVFDIGCATRDAIWRIADGQPAIACGGRGEHDNGNGSLMRILPVALFPAAGIDELIERLCHASCITHGHPRSQLACVFFGLVVRHLAAAAPAAEAWDMARAEFGAHCQGIGSARDHECFQTVLRNDLRELPTDAIRSTGYVIDTLTTSLWCLLTTDSFRDCVLKAVNLGSDTDTTGCVAGGLAGVCHGMDAIPPEWIAALARHDDVAALFQKFRALV